MIKKVRKGSGAPTFSSYARQGTFAHAVGSFILSGGDITEYADTKPFQFEDHGEHLEWVIPTDMLEHVNTYVDHVRRRLATIRGKLEVERHVDLSFVREGMFGTLDAGVVGDPTIVPVLAVIDFKYGYVPVHLVDYDLLLDDSYGELGHVNSQLLYYAAGLAHAHGWEHEKVILDIVQPRCMELPAIQSTEISSSALKDWAENDLWKAAHAATTEGATLNPGEWCTFCDAFDTCPAAREVVAKVAGIDFAEVASEIPPVKPNDPGLPEILKWAPFIYSWIRAVEAGALEEMKNGRRIPGSKMVHAKTHRRWPTDDPDELAARLNAHIDGPKITGHALLGKQQLKTPKQMEPLVGKKAVNAVAEKPEGELTIAPLSDRRPAASAKSDFAGLEEGDPLL